MKNKIFKSIVFSGLLLSILILSFACKKDSNPKDLKFAFFLPPKHSQMPLVKEWVNKISKEAGIKITILQQGKPKDQYDNIAAGVVDFGLVIPSYTAGKFPLTSAIELPFLVDDAEKGSIALWETYEKYLKKEYKDVKILWMFVHGPGQVHTTKKPVKSLEDMKGLKIRTPGAVMAGALKRLGAVPVTMPIPQVYNALDRGTIDGVTIPWEVMRAFKFYDVLKYHTEVKLYTLAFFIAMNKNTYNSLSPQAKKIIDSNMGLEMSRRAGRAFADADGPGRKITLQKNGTLIPFSEKERKRWINAVKGAKTEWVSNMKKRGLHGDKVLEFLESKLK